MVHNYDEAQNLYSCFGIFCSFPCAKAYLIKHRSFNTPSEMLFLTKLARTYYGITESIKPAPPTERLKVFGGDLSIEEFRERSKVSITITHTPPMISFSMLFEERRTKNNNNSNNNPTNNSTTNQLTSILPQETNYENVLNICEQIPIHQDTEPTATTVPLIEAYVRNHPEKINPAPKSAIKSKKGPAKSKAKNSAKPEMNLSTKSTNKKISLEIQQESNTTVIETPKQDLRQYLKLRKK